MVAVNDPTSQPSPDFLIHGSDYLDAHPDFKLVGRKEEVAAVFDVLLRKNSGRNLVLNGQGGVGLSSIIMGVQASKNEPGTPFDIVGKSFYYLDTDALFASPDQNSMLEGFQKAMDTLRQSQNSVLVINDTKGFLDGVRNNGVSSIVNNLMRETRANKNFQVIFETADADLPNLFGAHSEIARNF